MMTRLAGRIPVTLFGMAIALSWSQIADAQRGGGRGFGGRGGMMVSSVDLASLETVETELKLTDEQKQQIADLRDARREEMRKLRDQADGDRREAVQKISEDASAKLVEVLDDEQEQRLAGILIQVDVGAALADPYVVAQLNMTDEQKAKLDQARQANRRAMRDAFGGAGELSREERRAKFEELRTTAQDNLKAALTAEQQAKLEELKGEPVEINWRELFGGRGRGEGGGRGRRGGENN